MILLQTALARRKGKEQQISLRSLRMTVSAIEISLGQEGAKFQPKRPIS
jgi:hypothetical protein